MKVSERLFKKIKPIWDSYLEHPFVKGIAEGTLDVEKFKYYMVQDHKYLMKYARVFALGVIKAESEQDMRRFNSMLTETIDSENEVHQSYLKRLGITKQMIEEAPMCLTNESYTNYMISEAFTGDIPEILTTVLACSWSYKYIGDFMENLEKARNHEFYGEWVAMYISEEYRKNNELIIDMLDQAAKDLDEKRIQKLEYIIENCSKYEYDFWEMAWNKGDKWDK